MPKELNELLDEFERADDPGHGLRRLLDQVPSLRRDLEKAANDGNLTAIRYANTGGTNGTYDYQTKTLTLNQALRPGVDARDPDSTIALAYVAGHEGNHATRGDVSLAHTAQLKLDVEQVYAQGRGVRDYTALAGRHVDYLLREESLAEIGGFNAAMAATKWVERIKDNADALQSLAQKGPGGLVEGPAALTLGQLSQYIEGVQTKLGTDYQLKGGVRPDEDGLLNPADNTHLAFMRANFSDRRHGDPSLDRYYRHTAAADVVRLAIGAGSQHADIGLDMQALGVRPEGFAGKFRSPQGHAVEVGFRDVRSVLPPQVEPPQIEPSRGLAQDDGADGNSRKRARPAPNDEDGGGVDLEKKRAKPSLSEALLAQARECLTRDDCPQKMASRGVGDRAERLAMAAAVTAQNAGFGKVGAIAIGDDGKVWVLSAGKEADYAQNMLVGYDKSLVRRSEEQHLEALKKPPVENAPPPQIGAQNLGVNPKQL